MWTKAEIIVELIIMKQESVGSKTIRCIYIAIGAHLRFGKDPAGIVPVLDKVE